MDILRFDQFIRESKDSDYLLYYAFDWDDNILRMTTVIHMEKKEGDSWIPVDVSTAEFAVVRNDIENYRTSEDAFCEFRDSGPRGEDAFLIDVKDAISKNRFGPAWDDFIECLTHGSIFAIITARGHEIPAMRRGVEYIIDDVLTIEQQEQMYNYLLKYTYLYKDEENDQERILKGRTSENIVVKKYLDQCDFVGVSAPSRGGSPASPEKSKEIALLEFKDKVNKLAASIGLDAKIGFSDDDVKNVKHIEDLVDNLNKERFPNIIEFVVKNTKNPNDITKKVRVMEGTNQGSGLESSVLSCTQFGNMTGRLYPSDKETRQDDYLNQSKRQVKYLSGVSKDLQKEVKRSRKKKKIITKKPSE